LQAALAGAAQQGVKKTFFSVFLGVLGGLAVRLNLFLFQFLSASRRFAPTTPTASAVTPPLAGGELLWLLLIVLILSICFSLRLCD
jgi:hypothetical protein